MKVTTTVMKQRSVIAVDGDFSFDSVMAFRKDAEALVKAPAVENIVVDFERTTYIDSSALGILLVLRDQCSKAGKTLVLAKIPGSVRQVLSIAKFDKLFVME